MQSTVNQTCALKYNKEVFRSFWLATNNGCFTMLHRVVDLHNYRISTPLVGAGTGTGRRERDLPGTPLRSNP